MYCSLLGSTVLVCLYLLLPKNLDFNCKTMVIHHSSLKVLKVSTTSWSRWKLNNNRSRSLLTLSIGLDSSLLLGKNIWKSTVFTLINLDHSSLLNWTPITILSSNGNLTCSKLEVISNSVKDHQYILLSISKCVQITTDQKVKDVFPKNIH